MIAWESKEIKMKMYSVMGPTPGDGSVQKAEDHFTAFCKHLYLDYNEDKNFEHFKERVRIMVDANKSHTVKVSETQTNFGDYEVKEVQSN